MIEETHTLKCQYKGVQPYVKVTAYELSAIDCSADRMSGYYGQESTLISDDPQPGYDFANWSVTGSNVTGNNVTFRGDITAKANYSAHKYNVTLQNDGHGSIAASKTTGNTNDIITLSNTANNNYYFNNYSITGATLTGNQFKIQTSDVTAKANFAAMPVSSLFASSNNNGISAYTNQTKTFTVNVNTATCNYIKMNFYRSYHFNGGNNGMGWSIPELGWTGRNTSVITTALELRNGSFTRNNQFWNSANVITTGGNQWIINGTDASTLRYVYDVKNHRMSALYGGYVVGYSNCSTLGNTLSFKLTVGGTLGSAYMNNFRVAGFRDYTAATAWNY